MELVKVNHNQSLMDIALQVYGEIEGAKWLIEDNSSSTTSDMNRSSIATITLHSIIDNISEGNMLLIRNHKKNVNKQLYLSPYFIATLDDSSRGEGIGFWLTEEYIVQ